MIKNKDNKYKFIEVCAGCGGLSSGLIKSGLMPILINDVDKDCCNTLKLNHPNVTINQCSLTDLDLMKHIDKVDLLTGGVPCQSFSQAGMRKGLLDKRGDLMIEFIKLIKKLRPKMFMIENVKGLKTHKKGETLNTILNEIDNINLYNVKYEILNAVNYDVPQKRERIIIIGILKKYDVSFKFPKKSDKIILLKDVLYNVPKSECAKYSDKKKELFKLIPQGGCWINLPINKQKEYLGKSYESGGGKRGILRKLSMNEPSLTLLCSPTQKQTERCHPFELRPLSLIEYSRIQTFEDTYKFSGSVSSIYKQIGNAVPVNLAYKLGKSIVRCLKKCK